MGLTRATEATSTIVEWLQTWQSAINKRAYEVARQMFDPSVLGFGTRKEVVHGLDDLEHLQWRPTWPRIERFRFDVGQLQILLNDHDIIAAATTWTSLGIRDDGSRFDRAGRMTVILRHDQDADAWKAIHTHFSITPESR
jgi:ketosteroid isomerase-like protein